VFAGLNFFVLSESIFSTLPYLPHVFINLLMQFQPCSKKIFAVLLVSFIGFSSFFQSTPKKFPYKKAGFTERAAAAHLLNRFSFGATPNQIDAVVAKGLEKWFAEQLEASLPDTQLQRRLQEYDDLSLTNTEVLATFPRPALIQRMAIKDGVLNVERDSLGNNKKEQKEIIKKYMDDKGYKPQQDLFRQFINSKILHCTYSENQLQEVMTDFWFNHFNVSMTKNECAHFIPAYERDVIRPNALGNFEKLLEATAKSPAMLTYLDNASSSGSNTTLTKRMNDKNAQGFLTKKLSEMGISEEEKQEMNQQLNKLKAYNGLNENYARELMELHTLGVDGGYTQKDVTEAARILTGWTLFPMNEGKNQKPMKHILERLGEEEFKRRGFVKENDFLFAANRHDTGSKVVLGRTFQLSNGYEEGMELLHMLATNNATAQFICKKIATRFVCDTPAQTLVDKMATTFLKQKGDIKKVLITMVGAPEFWDKQAIREKVKSPFELAISTFRALNADIVQPYQVFNWLSRMGQKIYFYQAPTGFPDRGQYWINTGALLNRMNFGLAAATQKIPGININLAALNNNHEPESAEDALRIYSKLLMPERDLTLTIQRLTPLLNLPNLDKKITAAAQSTAPPPQMNTPLADDNYITPDEMADGKRKKIKENPKAKKINNESMTSAKGNYTMLSQVVGVIVGSPEFQRK